MTQLVAPTLASGASLASFLAAFLKFGASTVTVVSNAVEGGAASNPNIAPTTVDRTNMRPNASVGVYAAESGASGFVVTEGGTKGLQYVSASGLTATYSAGTAWVIKTSVSPDDMVRVTKTTTWTVLLTATSDNYVYIKSDGSTGVATTTVGGAIPTIPADSLLLGLATTNGSTVTGTPTDLSSSSTSTTPPLFRSVQAWPYPSSTTNFRLPPGAFGVGTLSVNNTTNTDLAVNVAGNYLLGVHTSGVHVYFICGNNGGAAKYGLTTSTPSAASIVAGVTAGSVGFLQFRTISGVPYRYLGSARLSTTGVMKMYSRIGREVMYNNSINVLTAGTQTTSTAIALAAHIPATGRKGYFDAAIVPAGATSIFLKESSATGTGQKSVVPSSGNYSFKAIVPTSAAQKIMYRVGAGDSLAMELHGYTEALD